MKKILLFLTLVLGTTAISQPVFDTLNSGYTSQFAFCTNENYTTLIDGIVAYEPGLSLSYTIEVFDEYGAVLNDFDVSGMSAQNPDEVIITIAYNAFSPPPGVFNVGVVVKNSSNTPSDTLKYTFIGEAMPTSPIVTSPGYFCTSDDPINLRNYFTDPNIGTTSHFEIWNSNGELDGLVSADGMFDPSILTQNIVSNNMDDIYFVIETTAGCYIDTYWDWYNYVLFPTDVTSSVTDASDCSTNDGLISITASGPSSHITDNYLAHIPTGDSVTFTGLSPAIFSNLYSGVYNITIEDDSGCVTYLTESIESPDISVTGIVSDLSCVGFNDGAIDITVSAVGSYTVYWEHGVQTEDVSNLAPGIYTIVVTSDAGCQTSKTFTIEDYALELEGYAYQYECHNPSSTYSGNIEVFTSQESWVNKPFNFTFPQPGGITMNNDSSAYGYTPGTYTISVEDVNGCIVTKDYTVGAYADFEAYPNNVVPSDCGGANGSIEIDVWFFGPNASDSLFQASWSNGATTKNIYNLTPGTYTYTMEHVTSSLCDFVLEVEVPASKPLINELCLITVDTISTTNVLVWEELETSGIDHYNIYRKNNSGVYVKIGETDAADESYYNDTYASPLIQSWSYKITAVNDCGIESDKSASHRTIHLRREINGSDVTLYWNDYEGFNYTDHVIHRFTASTGWEEIGTVPKSQNSYTDTPPDMTGLDYAIEVDPGYSCVSDKATSHNASRSNRSNGIFNPNDGYTPPIDDSNVEELVGLNITMYPNPTSSDVTVTVNGANSGILNITGMNGQLISSKEFNNNRIVFSTDDLSNGIYLISIESNDYTIVKKLVVNH